MADYDEGTPLPEGTEIFETEDGLRWAEVDGEVYIETDSGDLYHHSMFEAEDDEPATDDEVPAWAQPLLEREARASEDEVRADERSRVEAEEDDDEAPLVGFLRERPHLLDDFENYIVAVDKADGDLELGQQYYENAKADHEAVLDRARLHENVDQPASVEAGIDEWQSEQREAKRAEPYRHDPVRGDDPMQDAVNSLVDDLHETNQTNAYAQEIVRQERRGR